MYEYNVCNVCMYVCMYVMSCMHVMYACMYACMYLCMHSRMYVMYVCMYVSIYVMYVCMSCVYAFIVRNVCNEGNVIDLCVVWMHVCM